MKVSFVQDPSVPGSVLEFEAGFAESVGENGAAVHLSGEEKARGEELQKTWAFNKVTYKFKINPLRTLYTVQSAYRTPHFKVSVFERKTC